MVVIKRRDIKQVVVKMNEGEKMPENEEERRKVGY